MDNISLPSILNAIIGVTSYYYVILQVVMLHDAMKTIQNGFLCIFLNHKNLFLFKNPPKPNLKNKKPDGLFFFKNGFFSTLIIF